MAKLPTTTAVPTTIRIKEAAHQVFLEKGYTSATIREIADAAGTNVALLNYHFGSKKALYREVMQEKIQQLFDSLLPVFSDEDSGLDQKIVHIVNTYTDFLFANPTLPTFLLNEIRKSNFEFVAAAQLARIPETHIMQQLREVSGGQNPLQYLLSIIGMIVFPFMVSPGLQHSGLVTPAEFREMMIQRKALIPGWVKSILRDAKINSDK